MADNSGSSNDSSSPSNISTLTSLPPPPPSHTPSLATTTTPNEPQPPLREDMVKSAVSFLSSPKVRSADQAKKIAFLRNKGLNQAEIDEAFKRVPGSDAQPAIVNTAGPSSSPAVPPRPALSSAPPAVQIAYYQPSPPPRMTTQSIIRLAVVTGVGAVGVTAVLVGIIKRIMSRIFRRIAVYQCDRYNQHKALLERLNTKLKAMESSSAASLDVIRRQQTKSLENLQKVQTDIHGYIDENEPYAKFLNALNGFKDQLTHPDVIFSSFNTSNNFGLSFRDYRSDDSVVQGFKSEIRSFKGMLLSRRNFPSVKPTTTFSTQVSPATPPSTESVATPNTNTNTKLPPNTASSSPTSSVDLNNHPRHRSSFRADLAKEHASSNPQ
ncbi:peroxisomal membrane anchor protein conserved region-domain-containing protein [Radiomyces spectabilis]|uniref:peroxisomal membrane anchor protein conserved region-domain-containing protein n=1 Tax=Radiomyces spectabilis TaxID=64574 RepID=UPI00221F68AB|nr:peroxisomal membrane anchor protein conserved region-domain-containing protein [Radiomyces spectabilis]KAI8384419.1 peroxisomal membrane anchor protein conserved region-domain-containing protein [Radiomyces spectabilis]